MVPMMDYDGESNCVSPPGEKTAKRRMKTPFQLEALERVYEEDHYPTEAVRAELSLHLKLSDKQLQMWFCHRRLKDRKGKEEDGSAGRGKQQKTEQLLGSASRNYLLSKAVDDAAVVDMGARSRSDAGSDDLGLDEPYKRAMWGSSASPYFKKREGLETDSLPAKRIDLGSKFGGSRVATGTAAVSHHGGDSVQDDGPVMGTEFDPLPPGGLELLKEQPVEQSTPVAPPLQQQREQPQVQQTSGKSKSGSASEIRGIQGGGFGFLPVPRPEVKHKPVRLPGQQFFLPQGSPPAPPREFQFLPEQPTPREEVSGRQSDLSLDPNSDRCGELGPDPMGLAFPSAGPLFPPPMRLGVGDSCGYPQPERPQNVGFSCFLQNDSLGGAFCTANGFGLDQAEQLGLFTTFESDVQQADIHQSVLQSVGTSQPFMISESLGLYQQHEQAIAEKKRKLKEMKDAKESEAQAKRIRRDMERQEIVRQKQEEMMRKKMVKEDREKRREEERATRERQRQEERILREQKRNAERQEKMQQKESKRVEKQHLKEELRKVREAARLKAASERAAAKKLSRESLDTIDDEQLELLELEKAEGFALANGSMNPDPQPADDIKVAMKTFPPPEVHMKVPFSTGPWILPEDCVGHLFMVWRFLTTFADVLELWTFTLDEFAQALHDFDSRLLSEIHIALLRMMIKNIEDAAHAAGGAAAGSQSAMALATGGHPQIVEAAYEWGFDVQEWGRHVGPLTWPEILRQFALAAGCGPKWRKRCTETPPAVEEETEDQSADANVVKTLRSGDAAANAVALMQEKGLGHFRKCQYRLTPGTVKYAAFHVLSLEGSKGLTILEVADKIQKSGLRDLTTSKTPEASIAAALSRDTNLFERVAPSTYSVRVAFRRDAENTEEVLETARERIRLFQSGFLEADKETDDAEAEELEVEGDGSHDSDEQDVEDGDAVLPKDCDVKEKISEKRAVETKTEDDDNEDDHEDEDEDDDDEDEDDDDEMEIDESHLGESWVQGLTEGEYSDLSVKERLMALVAVINVVNEGNAIRLALETRMEAASALKRHIWAEVQIERRRQKEEQMPRLQPGLSAVPKIEPDESGAAPAVNDSAVVPIAEGASEGVAKMEIDMPVDNNLVPDDAGNQSERVPVIEANVSPGLKSSETPEKNVPPQDGVVLSEVPTPPAQAIERSRPQVSPKIQIWAEDLYAIRSVPLGFDRKWNRYWQFVTRAGEQDPGHGLIYFESSLDGHWGVIDNEGALDALMNALDVRGTREAKLHADLVRLGSTLRASMRRAAGCAPLPVACNVDAVSPVSNMIPDSDRIQEGSDPGVVSGTADLDTRSLSDLEVPKSLVVVVNQQKPGAENCHIYDCLREFDQWIWNKHSSRLLTSGGAKSGRKRDSDILLSCGKCHDIYWTTDRHCQLCHATFAKTQAKQDSHAKDCAENLQKSPYRTLCPPFATVPPRMQTLKADIISMEVIVPSDTFKYSWHHRHRKAWASSLKVAIAPSELLHSLSELERNIRKDCLSSSNDKPEVTQTRKPCMPAMESWYPPWMPHTSAAVSLRVMAFEASLACTLGDKKQPQK